ncbi:unnamed protein product [Psylliodes chrysocephalus]|uniref:FLYWCH-type domain-containing protein n=1 Tax=Psylliodes chrysocephalus TaxID=3402493 RepID=A0A9P0DEB5_9CUCU|nr:unnamed protein product [Psylliodes chrysocephala]
MSALKCILSEKGKELLIYIYIYKYRFHKELTGGIKRWVCSVSGNKKCTTHLKTEGKTNIIAVVDNHNHPPLDEIFFNRNEVSNSLKRKASEDLSEIPLKFIHRELRKGDVETLTNCDVKCIRNNIYHSRRSFLPKLPTTQREVHNVLNSYPVMTNRGETFLLILFSV